MGKKHYFGAMEGFDDTLAVRGIYSKDNAVVIKKVARKLGISFRTLKKEGESYIHNSNHFIVESGKVFIQIGNDGEGSNLTKFWDEVKKEKNKKSN